MPGVCVADLQHQMGMRHPMLRTSRVHLVEEHLPMLPTLPRLTSSRDGTFDERSSVRVVWPSSSPMPSIRSVGSLVTLASCALYGQEYTLLCVEPYSVRPSADRAMPWLSCSPISHQSKHEPGCLRSIDLTSSSSTTLTVAPLCLTHAPSPLSGSRTIPCPCSTTSSPPAESNCMPRGSRRLFATTWTRNPGATDGAPCAGAMELGHAAADEEDWA